MTRENLSLDASGLRHLRWAREILGSLAAHYEHNPKLAQAERDLLLEEAVKLRALVNGLSAAVKAYRDFLERERTGFRGMLRVAEYLITDARGGDEKAEAEAVREGLEEAFAAMEAKERAPRKAGVREAVAELREGLDEMDARLRGRVPVAVRDSLYPRLTEDRSRVLDDGDGDDDAAG
jgi:hypothetical protein